MRAVPITASPIRLKWAVSAASCWGSSLTMTTVGGWVLANCAGA